MWYLSAECAHGVLSVLNYERLGAACRDIGVEVRSLKTASSNSAAGHGRSCRRKSPADGARGLAVSRSCDTGRALPLPIRLGVRDQEGSLSSVASPSALAPSLSLPLCATRREQQGTTRLPQCRFKPCRQQLHAPVPTVPDPSFSASSRASCRYPPPAQHSLRGAA